MKRGVTNVVFLFFFSIAAFPLHPSKQPFSLEETEVDGFAMLPGKIAGPVRKVSLQPGTDRDPNLKTLALCSRKDLEGFTPCALTAKIRGSRTGRGSLAENSVGTERPQDLRAIFYGSASSPHLLMWKA